MLTYRFLLLLLASLVPAAAQEREDVLPSAEAVLDAWAADWRRAAAGVDAVEMDEVVEREVEGPRRPISVTIEGAVRYSRGQRPERTPQRVVVNGREISADRLDRQGRRLGRAFGPAGREVAGPPPLPHVLLAQADGASLQEDRVDGRPAWRVDLRPGRGPADQITAWFTRSETDPRLLRSRVEGQRPGGRAVREIDYVRVGGLDLPAEARAEATVRQRRRLREYVVTLRAEGRYSGHRLVRSE